MSSFPGIASLASLIIELVLFLALGLFYTIFAAFFTASPKEYGRPPIVNVLRLMCQIIATLIIFSASLFIYSLVLYLSESTSNINNVIIGTGLALIVIFIAVFSVVLTFRYMVE